MKKRNSLSSWKKILDLCDELGSIKEALEEGGLTPAQRRRHRAGAKKAAMGIQTLMAPEARTGLLAPILKKKTLPPEALVVLAILLARYVSPGRSEMAGREILDLLCDSSYKKLQAIEILQPTAGLRHLGLVEVETKPRRSDPLDTTFRLSEKVIGLFSKAGIAKKKSTRRRKRSYRNNREFLLELKALKGLYQQRAQLVFDPNNFNFSKALASNIRNLDRKISQLRKRVEETLRATPRAGEFAALRFWKSFDLSEEEMVIVVGMLFQEILEGEAFAEAMDLLKLVSRGEEDLIRNRQLLRPSGKLIRRQILVLEDMVAGKETTAEVVLSNWVVERLLEEESDKSIATDEKIDFHNYLKNLDSAEKFLRDLTGD